MIKERHYVTLRNGVRTHLVDAPFEGTRTLCGVFIPLGAGATTRDTLWRVKPCKDCAAVLRRGV